LPIFPQIPHTSSNLTLGGEYGHIFWTPKIGRKKFSTKKSNDKHHRLITKITVRPSFLRSASTTRGVRRSPLARRGRSPPAFRTTFDNARRSTSTPRDGVKSTAVHGRGSFVVAVSRCQQLKRSASRSGEHGTTERQMFRLRLHQRV